MPTLELSKITTLVNKDTVYLKPVISVLVGGNSGYVNFNLIRNTSELDLYFPDIVNRDSYAEILNNSGVLYMNRVNKYNAKLPDRSSYESRNLANVIIGDGVENVNNLGYINNYTDYGPDFFNDDKYTIFSEYNEFDKLTCESLYNGKQTLSYIIRISDVQEGDYVLIPYPGPAGTTQQSIRYIFGPNGTPCRDGENAHWFNMNSTAYVPIGQSDAATLSNLFNIIRSDTSHFPTDKVYIPNTASNIGTIYYATPMTFAPFIHCGSGTTNTGFIYKDTEYNLDRLLMPFLDTTDQGVYETDFHKKNFCLITSKLIGPAYDRIKVKFSFPSIRVCKLEVEFDEFNETFLCSLNENDDSFIENEVNNNSRLINVIWNYPSMDIISSEARQYLTNLNYVSLGRAATFDYDIVDWIWSLNKLTNNTYKTYLLLDDSPFTKSTMEQYRTALINRAIKLQCCLGIIYHRGEGVPQNIPMYDKMFFIRGALSIKGTDIQITPLTPVSVLASRDLFLGVVDYNLLDENEPEYDLDSDNKLIGSSPGNASKHIYKRDSK